MSDLISTHLKINGFLALGIAALMTVGAAGPAYAAEETGAERLLPHRALYDMTLAEVRQGASVSSARGVMYYRFEPLCDGWEVETRVALRLGYGTSGEQETIDTKWSFSSFETFDEKRFSFQVDHSQGDSLLEVYDGDAFRDADTGEGKADFYVPGGTETSLPAGTVFPAQHLVRLLDAARGGGTLDHSTVFDGASIVNPYSVNTVVIGRVENAPLAGLLPERPRIAQIDTDTAKAVPAKLEAGEAAAQPVWRFRMAYFPVNEPASLPDFELEIDYREDGVATRIEQDFGDFALNLTPSRIETLPYPDCSK